MTKTAFAAMIAIADPFDIVFSFLAPPSPRPPRRPKKKPVITKK